MFLLFTEILLFSGFGEGQDFRVDDYPALAVMGRPGLDEDTYYVSFAGDFGFSRRLPSEEVIQKHLAFESRLFSRFDLGVINLEFMLPGMTGDESDKRIDEAAIRILKMAGFDLVCRSNNHALDFGLDGIKYNETRLRAAGFATVGTKYGPSYTWSAGGSKIAFYAFTDDTDKEDPEHAVLTTAGADLDVLRTNRGDGNFKIALVHLGSAGRYVSPHEREVVNRLIDAGADMIVSTGSHFIKGHAIERGKPVFYGLGNHLFSEQSPHSGGIGMYAVAGFESGRLVQMFVVPFWNDVDNGKVGPLDEPTFASFKRDFLDRSHQSSEDRYFSDPVLFENFQTAVASITISDIQNIKVRHLKYAVLILINNYPMLSIFIVATCVLLTILVTRRLLYAVSRHKNVRVARRLD